MILLMPKVMAPILTNLKNDCIGFFLLGAIPLKIRLKLIKTTAIGIK